MLTVDSPDCDPEGDETITSCGTAVGFTTSGCYSPAVRSGLALANLPVNLAQAGTRQTRKTTAELAILFHNSQLTMSLFPHH